MKTTYILTALLVLGFQGTMFADDYSLDGTEEPEAIPDLRIVNDVDGPVRLSKTAVAAAAPEKDVLVRDGDIPLHPPKLVRTAEGELKTSDHYMLVQYSSSNRSRTKKQQEEESKTPAITTPSAKELNTMSDAERLAALKKSIQATLVANTKRGVTTQHNMPGDVLLMAMPYGADARIYQPNVGADPRDKNAPKGNYVYSVGALCWNYPCAGKTLLRSDSNRIIAKVGYGYQSRPGSLLALLAMSNIMPNYELKVGGGAYTIAHLIASERAAVSRGSNMSMELVALAFYGEAKDQWKNEMGETWNIEKMVTEELNRSIDQGSSDVTDWLLGLTSAVRLYEEESKPIRGPMALAKKQLKTYQDFVLSVQNDQYLWHPKFFLYKGSNPDAYETLYSSGHILRWLVYSLPDKELQNPQVIRAVAGLTSTINRVPSNVAVNALSDRQLEGLAVSLHAISLYNQRVFGEEPAEPKQPEKSVAQR